MNQTIASLHKTAEELVEWVAALEGENSQLKTCLEEQHKEASQKAPVAPVVSEDVAEETCQALVKAGALTEDQVALVKEGFITDPSAAHRAIIGILDSRSNNTKEAASQEFDLSGGQTVGSSQFRKSAEDECFENMRKILNV